jgi:type VI secretion system secreted protein Hcp
MFDAYLSIDGVPGESTDDKHKDWIEVLSFGHEMSQPVSSTKSSSGGATSGRTQHGDFQITKFVDKSSPKLYDAVSNGKHFSKVSIEVCRSGGSQVKFMEIKMEQVLISKVALDSAGAHGGSNGNGATNGLPAVQASDLLPTETVHLNYGKIEWTYTQQKRSDGSGGGNVNAKYDLTAGKGA